MNYLNSISLQILLLVKVQIRNEITWGKQSEEQGGKTEGWKKSLRKYNKEILDNQDVAEF